MSTTIRRFAGLVGLAMLFAMTGSSIVTVVLTLSPSATVTGAPGSTTGWGYTITNNSSQYVVIANSYFCQSAQDPLFTTCTQTLGTYGDFIANNATVIAPGVTVSKSFSSSGQGVGGYAVINTAKPGQKDTGSIVLVYDLYTANPFTDASATQVGGDVEISVPAGVQIPAPPLTVSAPAMSWWALVLLGLLLMASAARRLGGAQAGRGSHGD